MRHVLSPRHSSPVDVRTTVLRNLQSYGFECEAGRLREGSGDARRMRVRWWKTRAAGNVTLGKSGVLIGDEIGVLVSRGYQMFLRTPSGREIPALAKHLHQLHDFDEDLREGLGLTSLYNLSLGTTSTDHLYDRVEERDEGPHHHAWDKPGVISS